jgi:beta-lactamase class A
VKTNPLHLRSWFLPALLCVLCVSASFPVPCSAQIKPVERARQEIEKLIAQSGAEVGIAFRTLDGKMSLSVHPDLSMHAASTMKVPVMIELFAQARAGKLRLDDELPVKNEFKSIVDGSPYQLDVSDDSDADVYKMVGKTMTLRALCEKMITVSSNLATNLLIEKLGVENIQKRVHALHADGMKVLRGVEDGMAFQKGLNNTTTAQALLTLLEAIAKKKAGHPRDGDEMISILRRQQFNDGIPAGLPAGTPVAHKTGEITRINHDAAIVYAPRPFVLVVLVRGIEEKKKSDALMAAIAREVSRAAQAK